MGLLTGANLRIVDVRTASGETMVCGITVASGTGAGGATGGAPFATTLGAGAAGSAAGFGCVTRYDTPAAAATPARNPNTIFRFMPIYSCGNNVPGYVPTARTYLPSHESNHCVSQKDLIPAFQYDAAIAAVYWLA